MGSETGDPDAAARLDLGAELFESLLESAPDAIVIVDERGRMVLVNGQAEELFGYTREEMLGRPVELLVPGKKQDVHAVHRDAYMRDPHTRPMGIGLDLAGRRKDGSEVPVEISLSPIDAGQGRLVTAIVRDISERRRADQVLRESERRFREFVEGTDDLVTRVDAEGRFIYVNHTAERIFGIPPEECVGLSAFDFAHPEDRETTVRSFQEWVGQRVASVSHENRQVSRDGSVFHMLWTINPRYDEQGRITSITSIARDITDRKRYEHAERERIEAQLQLEAEREQARLRREVLRRSIQAQEEERSRISRELHDEAGQALTGAILKLASLSRSGDTERARAEAAGVRHELVEAVNALRGLAGRLRPSVLDDLGLVPALEQLIEAGPAARCGARVSLDHDGPARRCEPGVETTVYRVAQEALTNAARHAQARQIRVELTRADGKVTVTVSDDGVGFDPGASTDGLGLAGMRERAELVGGELEVDSEPGRGTRVTLSAPMRGRDAGR